MIKLPIPHKYNRFRIVLVGAGGTGGNLAPMMARLLAGNQNVSFAIVDGDVIEKSNLERQPYLEGDLGQNKAESLSRKLSIAFGIDCSYLPSYITCEKDLENLFLGSDKKRLDILIGAVDNHDARVTMERFFEMSKTLVYIDSANEDYFGDVVLAAKTDKEVFLKSRGMYRPLEVFKGTKRIKERSCEIKAADNPQYYPANQFAATIVLKMVSDIIIESNIRSHFVSFDTHEYMMFHGVEGAELDCDLNYSLNFTKTIKVTA